MQDTSPRVSVIVPTHNRAHTLPETLDAIAAQDYPGFELIVVDDSSEDATPEVLAAYQDRVRTLRVEYRSPARTRNAGAKAALGEYLLFTDDDCIPPPDWISRMLEAHARHGCTALSGGFAPYRLDTRIQRYQHYRMRLLFRDTPKQVRGVPVINFLIAREAFWDAGGFDETLNFALEDWVFCSQLRSKGGTIGYEPAIQILHRYREETEPVIRHLLETARDAVPIAAKLGQSPERMMARSMLKFITCPLWSTWSYPRDLHALSCRIETRFFLARLRSYLRYRLGAS